MQRVTWKDIIKMWLHREGMATPHRPCKHTHTASTIGLNLHIAHTCFWFLAARHSLLSLSLAQEAQQAGQRRSLASACWGSQSARISRASLDKTREVTLASKKQQCFALHPVTEASGPDCEQLPHNKMNCRVQWGGVHEDKSSDLGNVSFRSGWKYLSV